MVFDLIQSFFQVFLDNLNYWSIFVLMAIESSFIPFPSEIVMIPAGVLISEGSLSWTGVLIAGILGSLFGALVNYYLALHLGRRIVDSLVSKYGKFILLSEKGLKKSEDYFKKYGKSTTFFGRLIPVVRQLISLPAGFSKMPIVPFILYTSLGAGIWCFILVLLGFIFKENWEIINQYLSLTSMIVIACLALFVAFYLYLKRNKN